jgi:MFS superfamily sulfate permease-like transporter
MASLGILLYQLSSVNNLPMGVEKGDSLRHVPLDIHHQNAVPCVDGIVVFRPVATLFFGNAYALRTACYKVLHPAVEDTHTHTHTHVVKEVAMSEGGEVSVREKVMVSANTLKTNSSFGTTLEEEDEENSHRHTHTHLQDLGLDLEAGDTPSPPPTPTQDLLNTHTHAHTQGQTPTHILIDACAIRVLDLTALGAICDIVEEAESLGVYVYLTNCSHRLKYVCVCVCVYGLKKGGSVYGDMLSTYSFLFLAHVLILSRTHTHTHIHTKQEPIYFLRYLLCPWW